MKITSPAFEDSQMMPALYTCDGDNLNPPLEFSEVPEDTKSLALIMDDPDAPGGTFTHWLMWNIPPDTKNIDENDWLDGAEQGMNDAGELGYLGPCPPSGVHHYHFNLYAFNTTLKLAGEIKREDLDREINNSLIEKAQLIGLYELES